MTIADDFMIGTSLDGLQTFEEIGIDYEPDASFRPFAVVDKLGDGTEEGNGFPVATWHFNAMAPGDADILYDYIGTGLSALIFIRTRINRLNEAGDNYQFQTFKGRMNWMSGDESTAVLHALDVTITFTNLILIPSYPYP